MKVNKLYNLDCREGLSKLELESIDCCISSPPYWSLRDYGIEPTIWDGDPECEHKFEMNKKKRNMDSIYEEGFCSKCGAWKGSLGLEPNFELYIKHLADIYDLVFKALKKSGTCWVNLGDTYASSTTEGYNNREGRWQHGKSRESNPEAWQKSMVKRDKSKIKPKCLMMLPQRFAIEMINRGWILRNVIIWHKPNCMPSSAKDRFTVDFEYVYFFVKNKKYWFEQQRDPLLPQTIERDKYSRVVQKGKHSGNEMHNTMDYKRNPKSNPLGKNKRTVWKIPTKPNPEAHFATFPPKLIEPMIKAGCPEYVCVECGKPRFKIIESKPNPKRITRKDKPNIKGLERSPTKDYNSIKTFKGYTDCVCGKGFESGIVLDPFAGIGTTLKEAWKLGRNYIGFEISKEYCEIAKNGLNLTKNKRLDDYF